MSKRARRRLSGSVQTSTPLRTAGRASLIGLLWLLSVVTGPPAWAQEGWDPAVYTGLIETGRTRFEQAQAAPAGSTARRDLLVGSLSANRQAQSMLHEAVLSGAVDDYRADAVAELFNLTDNLIVALLDLDQCEAAAAEIERLADDEGLLPPDAAGHIATLRDSLQMCRERVASAPAPWNLDAYREAEARADTWRQRANQASGPDERVAALYEATLAEDEALQRLRGAALADRPTPGVAPAQALGVHYNRVVTGLFQMGLCDAAERRLEERRQTLNQLDLGAAGSDYVAELDACREHATARADATEPADQPVALPTSVEVVERRTNAWPYVLLGVGGTAAIAALVVDLSLAGDRDDFDALEAACDGGGPCNFEALELLGDSIDRHKIIVGVLAGVAVAAGVSGLVWLLVSDDDEAPAASVGVSPFAGPDGFGASVRVTH